MQKHYNTIINYFSLFTRHFDNLVKFNQQTEAWFLNETDDFRAEVVTNNFISNRLTFTEKIMFTTEEISNLTKVYLEKLYFLRNTLAMLMKQEGYIKQ